MGSPITGKKLLCFFQDPHYWGHGQSFQGLSLRVNGKPIDAAALANGWDPSDICCEDTVELLGGIWHSMGWSLGAMDLPTVFECWERGQRPTPPRAVITPTPSAIDIAKTHQVATVMETQHLAVKRPVFMAPR